MSRHAALKLALAFAASLVFAATATAIPKTYVSRAGSDSNPCNEATPCRTFAGAITKTDAGGEIVVLDSGEYGPVTINKSVRITAEGVYAGVSHSYGIQVNAGSTAVVVLRGLTITGEVMATPVFGISISNGGVGALYVEDCIISGFFDGIFSRARGRFFFTDTIIRNNKNAGLNFDLISEYTAGASVVIDHCRLEQNDMGVRAWSYYDYLKVMVRDSVVASNTSFGFFARGPGVQLNVFDSAAVYNRDNGFFASTGGQINAHHCISSNNKYGFLATEGGIINAKDCTAANNTVSGMEASGAATMVSVEGCQLVNNLNGVHVLSGGAALVSDTMITGNGTGLKNNPKGPGVIESFGNNRVYGNTANKVGTVTAAGQM